MGGKSGSQTIGFWYYMDVLATLCHSPVNNPVDEIVELQFAERTGWTGSITTSRTLGLYKKDLFGGEKREGGVEGQIDVMMGEPGMSVNEYLGASIRKAGITGPVPAYRGVCSLFFRGSSMTNGEFADSPEFSIIGPETPPPPTSILGFMDPPIPAFRWVAMNPYFKKFRVRLRRYMRSWYPSKARIGNDANPVHIIYECFTDPDWGMGYPASAMSDSQMRAAADTLFTEGFGISIAWTEQSSIEDFIKLILQHINGVVVQDRTTGELFVKLVRNDYVVGSLTQLDPTNCRLESYDRVGIGDTVNEIVLNYTTADGKTDSVVVQDLANITGQGRVVSQSIDMMGLRNTTLATRVAQRELNSRVAPISKISLIANRTAYPLNVGSVFKLVWPDLGITAAYYRIIDMDLGRLDDNMITIDAVEDVFALPAASYSAPQTGGWVNPSVPTTASVSRHITEVPYYSVARELPDIDLSTIDATDGLLEVYAKAPTSSNYDYNLWTAIGTNALELRNTGSHTPTATLSADVIQEEFSTLSVDSLSALGGFTIDSNMMVMVNGEYMRIDNYDLNLRTITVARGVLDTVPKAHASGSIVYFVSLGAGRDGIGYLVGDSVKVKVQTRNGLGELSISSTPQDTYVITGRPGKPYPPARLRINGATYPANINGALSLTFATRNRTTQTANIVAQDVTSISPESNQLSRVIIKGETGTSFYDVTTSETSISLAIEDEAVSGRTDASANRSFVSSGLGVLTNTVGTAITSANRSMPKVNGGRLGVSSTNGVFVNTAGTTTTRTPGFVGTVANLLSLKPTVYTSYSATDSYVGYAVYGTMTSVSATDTRTSPPIRDRRTNPEFIICVTGRRSRLVYWAQTQASLKSLWYVDVGYHILQRSAVVTGPGGTNRVQVEGYFLGQTVQFDSPVTSEMALPSFSGALNDPNGDLSFVSQIGSIFGSLFYVTYIGAGTTINTAGKVVDISNVLTSHIDICQARSDRTRLYSINSAGVTSLISTRDAVVLADQVTATEGVEAQGTTLRTVNMTTGAAISTIATAASNVVAICGDVTNSQFYVLGINGTLYKYSSTGTLLGSLVMNISNSSANAYLNSEIHVSSQAVYVKDKNRTLHQVQKDLSSQRVVNLSAMFGNTGVTEISSLYAESNSTEMYWGPSARTGLVTITGGLVDESGVASTIPDIATPRYNDSLTIELSSVRDGVTSHTTNSFTTKRQGMGLRMGEFMGG